MNTLFAVWEIDPLYKVGGLGDVARSLPLSLGKIGVDARVIIPFYDKVNKKYKTRRVGEFRVKYAGIREKVELFEYKGGEGVFVYLLKNDKYLVEAKFPDTFAFFSKAVVELSCNKGFPFKPDIIHCNDLHTGLIPLIAKRQGAIFKTLLTIHNIAYQGVASSDILNKLEIEKRAVPELKLEKKRKFLNFLKEGIIHADFVTTVSPTYAKEIMTKEFGCGLEEIIRGKEGKVFGILNGIDIRWKDTREARKPAAGNWHKIKEENKLNLQKKLKIRQDSKIPLISFIGRFDPYQKGIDILYDAIKSFDFSKIQLVILGKGDKKYEDRFGLLSNFYSENVSINLEFNDELAHEIYASSDFNLIPSKYEPCGLVQMIAMSFGSIPIARRTGGLADSIKNNHNGLLFEKYSSSELEKMIHKAVDIYNNDRITYNEMVHNALTSDFSWRESAKKYLELYLKLLKSGSV